MNAIAEPDGELPDDGDSEDLERQIIELEAQNAAMRHELGELERYAPQLEQRLTATAAAIAAGTRSAEPDS